MPTSMTEERFNEVLEAFRDGASIDRAAARLGVSRESAKRYRTFVNKHGASLPTGQRKRAESGVPRSSGRVFRDKPYSVVIFSDAHFWPTQIGPAYWILLKVLDDLKPDIVIDNGDSFDGASISRHPVSSWASLPTVREEYETVRKCLADVREVAGTHDCLRVIGNHDLRLESYLAGKVPAMMGMPGTTISELFPEWDHNYSFLLNGHVYVKHRWHGGIHAAYNNALKSGMSIVTGHLHKLLVRPIRDLRGTRYGMEAGTLADPSGPQFEYTENNPLDWHQGFLVLTVDGDRVVPEIVEVLDGKAIFRGKTYAA